MVILTIVVIIMNTIYCFDKCIHFIKSFHIGEYKITNVWIKRKNLLRQKNELKSLKVNYSI